MTDLFLTPSTPASGYAARSRRSPGALAAAIVVNGGAFAIIIAMPATQYIVDRLPDTPTHWIDIRPDPKPETVKPTKPVPTQRAIPQEDVRPTAADPVVELTRSSGIIAGEVVPDLGGLGTTGLGDLNPPADPPRKAIFHAATQDPRYAEAFHPDYPPALRRQGLEGSVTVRVTIDENGRVSAVEMVKATNRAFFEETRDQALRYWRFRPATSDGAPVPSQQILTVEFNLED